MKKNKFKFLIYSFLLTLFFRIPYIMPYFSNVDEPEYALFGYKLLNGRLIYKEIFENKGFGLGYIYFIFMKIFKKNYLICIHFFYLFILFLNTFLIFKIIEKKANKNVAFLSIILYPVISTLFFPMDAHKGTEFIITFLILLAWFLMLYYTNYISIFISGIIIGISLYYKQFGIILIIGFSYVSYLLTQNLRKSIFYLLFGILPFLIFLFYIFQKGLVNDWIEWNIKYPLFMASTINIFKKIYFIFPMVCRIFLLNPFLLIFSFIFLKYRIERKEECLIILIITFIWGIIHGLPFPHHYIPFLTIIIIISTISYGTFISNFQNNKKIIFHSLIFFSILQSIFYWHGFDYHKKWLNFIKNKEWKEEFEKYKYYEIINYLEENTSENDKIIIWGFNPKIYLLSNREPGTRFIILDPVLGENFVYPPSINQYKYAEVLFLKDLETYKVKIFIDATNNSLINMSFFEIEKYPEIKKYLDKNFIFEKEISGFRIFKRK